MRILITGGSGFVGTRLTAALLGRGHEVTVLSRSEKAAAGLPAGLIVVKGDPTQPGKWQEHVAGKDVLVNLAGASIFRRWNAAYKDLLRSSRILTTRNLVDAIPQDSSSNTVLVSTSAVGYYGITREEELDESAPPGKDFLATLAQEWEAEALKAGDKGVRVVVTRFGVVLGRGAGALKQMAMPFRFFLGGRLGSGRQWFSWIHVEDLCRAAIFVMENESIQGPVNFTAPHPVRNMGLARAIGRVMGRPAFMPAPAFMIRWVLGEFGSVILGGQQVVPRILERNGFRFNFPHVDAALADLMPN